MFMEQVNGISINIQFIEAIVKMPKYAKKLKDLISNPKELENLSKVTLNEQCSAAIM